MIFALLSRFCRVRNILSLEWNLLGVFLVRHSLCPPTAWSLPRDSQMSDHRRRLARPGWSAQAAAVPRFTRDPTPTQPRTRSPGFGAVASFWQFRAVCRRVAYVHCRIFPLNALGGHCGRPAADGTSPSNHDAISFSTPRWLPSDGGIALSIWNGSS